MKLRSDFVSNSSSSSFIVLHDDNRFGILLEDSEDYRVQHLSLREYLDRFAWREIWGEDIWTKKAKKIKFVTDQAFAEKFATSFCLIAPKSCKSYFDELVRCRKEREAFHEEHEDAKWDDPVISKMLAEEEGIQEQILNKIADILKLQFGDAIFDYAEVSDNYNPDYDNDEYQCDEDKLRLRIEYIDSLKALKFYRHFNNH